MQKTDCEDRRGEPGREKKKKRKEKKHPDDGWIVESRIVVLVGDGGVENAAVWFVYRHSQHPSILRTVPMLAIASKSFIGFYTNRWRPRRAMKFQKLPSRWSQLTICGINQNASAAGHRQPSTTACLGSSNSSTKSPVVAFRSLVQGFH